MVLTVETQRMLVLIIAVLVIGLCLLALVIYLISILGKSTQGTLRAKERTRLEKDSGTKLSTDKAVPEGRKESKSKTGDETQLD